MAAPARSSACVSANRPPSGWHARSCATNRTRTGSCSAMRPSGRCSGPSASRSPPPAKRPCATSPYSRRIAVRASGECRGAPHRHPAAPAPAGGDRSRRRRVLSALRLCHHQPGRTLSGGRALRVCVGAGTLACVSRVARPPLSLRMAGRRAYRQSAAAGDDIDLPGTPERLAGRRPGPSPREDTGQHGGDTGR